MSLDSVLFGPVPSRRLGRSLGVNNIPPKSCSYSCGYCQVGYYSKASITRTEFYNPNDIRNAVQKRLAELEETYEDLDYLTIVPDGEPTLGVHLGKLIDRPHRDLILNPVLEGVSMFRDEYRGVLVTEAMLVKGVNDDEENMRKTASFLKQIEPSKAYIPASVRPPALRFVKKPEVQTLNRAYQIFQADVTSPEYLINYEGNNFTSAGTPADDLAHITAVHPMRKDAIREF